MTGWRLLLLVGCGLCTSAAAGQTVSYDGAFERAVNRYRWTAQLASLTSVGAWRIQAMNRYRSDAFILFDDRLSFRDVNALRISADRPLGERTQVVARARSDWFSLSDVLAQSVYGGVKFGASGATFAPLLGVAMDRRPGVRLADGTLPLRTDAGPAFGAEVNIPTREASGYTVQAAGQGFREQLGPRAGSFARFEGSAERAFERTVLRVEMQGGAARRDAYQAASFLNRDDSARKSETVESTRSDTLGATLMIETPVTRQLQLTGSLAFNANNRSVRTLRAPDDALFFDSDFSRRTVDADVSSVYESGATQFRVGFQGGAEIERRNLTNEDDLPTTQASQKRDLLSQANYDRGYVTLLASLRLPLTPKTMLVLDGSANAIRHDTPIINPDDRDEIFSRGRISLLYRPSRVLEADLQVNATHYHTVYLKSARSAENNVQQGLRLRPAVRWRPGSRTRIDLSSEVRATYTVDDFTLAGRRPTDQAARELRYDLNAEHDFGDGLRVLAEGRLSDLRLGRFLDKEFAEIPIDTLRTYGGWLRVQSGTRIVAEIGLRVFIRTDFDRSATVRYPRLNADGEQERDPSGNILTTTISRAGRQRIAQVGPTCSLTWPMRNGVLRFDGWYTIQRVSRTLYGDLPEASASVIRQAASRGERIIIPNLSLSMRWAI